MRPDFASLKLKVSRRKLNELMGSHEIMERDRAYIFKDTFHPGGLEPGAQDRYKEAMIWGSPALQKHESPRPQDHQAWPWRSRRWVCSFPNVGVTSIIHEFLTTTDEGKAFRNSKIFDLAVRAVQRPDTRTQVSCAYRPKKFWAEWERVYTGDDPFIDAFTVGLELGDSANHCEAGNAHNSTMLRLGYLREKMMGLGMGFQTTQAIKRGKTWQEGKYGAQDKFAHGKYESDDHVPHRGDSVLVMGKDEEELLKWCTAVTYALQTKPWLRELDL
ncbi:hypothetical protein B0H66DRAFT_606313 [Apodospora peruviana]|uniref:Uncharacterized protein n=1 Tax=Apodospora peruviana TaxID=516989 RepID=A0AAE0HYV8_9PEZI|nr:hypothetical protein B0H66DRAFT_606313 [Apodospora peruviana]